MTRTRTLDDLAGSSAALVQDYDLTTMLVRTIMDATRSLGAAAGGLLVTNSRGELELLSATSHEATLLETYQAITGEGPCRECMERQEAVEGGLDEVGDRWPELSAVMERSGYRHVIASPLLWRGAALGGLNLFFGDDPADGDGTRTGARLYSDLLTLFIVNAGPLDPAAARERLDEALEVRAVVEQAKGVLAEREGLDMPHAYDRLLDLEREEGRPLTDVARRLIADAHRH